MIMLPAGLVIPYIVDGLLHRITIRLIRKDPQQPKKKYHYVRGSIRDLWVSNPNAKAFVLQEAEFDCIAVDGAAGDVVGTIGLGSTGTKPDARTAGILKGSLAILDGLDFDQPRRNPQTGKMETPRGCRWQMVAVSNIRNINAGRYRPEKMPERLLPKGLISVCGSWLDYLLFSMTELLQRKRSKLKRKNKKSSELKRSSMKRNFRRLKRLRS